MPEVLLLNEDVTVLGPPTTIELLVDIGPRGDRGSQILVGTGNPNNINIGQEPELNDLFINTSPGAEYGYLYQYVAEPGGDVWVEVLQINPNIFSKNYEVTFSGGTGSIVIPIADITDVSAGGLASDNFSVQYSLVHDQPVASVMTSVTKSGSNLTIAFEAIEYNSGTWSNLAEVIVVHVFITVVESGES